MTNEKINLIQELTNEYTVKEPNFEEIEIRIRIPRKFKTLWLFKLSELSSNEKELKEFADQ